MLAQQLVNGIVISGIYALAALGLALILSTLDIPDFAQGQMYMLAAFIGYFLVVKYHFGILFTIFITMVIVAFLGVFVERLTYRRIRRRAKGLRYGAFHLLLILAAFAIGIILENAALLFFGEYVRSIPTPYSEKIYQFWGISIPQIRVIVIIIVGIIIAGLQIFITKSKWGKAMRAVAQNPLGAAMSGINLDRIFSITFAVGTAMGAATGCLLGIIFNVEPTMGFLPVLKGFVVIVVAGMGSMIGIILSSFLLGMAESLGGGYLSSAYTDTIAFGILIIALTLKPFGLLGRE